MKTDRKISGLRGLPREGGEYRSHITAPLLVLAVFLLLRLSVYIDSKLTRENEYAAVILLQLMIFVIPAVIYLALTRNTAAGLLIRPVGIGHLLLICRNISALYILRCTASRAEFFARVYIVSASFAKHCSTTSLF